MMKSFEGLPSGLGDPLEDAVFEKIDQIRILSKEMKEGKDTRMSLTFVCAEIYALMEFGESLLEDLSPE